VFFFVFKLEEEGYAALATSSSITFYRRLLFFGSASGLVAFLVGPTVQPTVFVLIVAVKQFD
jgi:hypothetical protein